MALTVLAWLYLLSLAQTMGPPMGPGISSMPAAGMGGMSAMDDMAGMVGMEMPGASESMAAAPVWSAGDAAFVLAMWCMMMVGMMLPSAAPMILLYARVGRHAAAQGAPFAATGIFAAGYLAVWFLFSLAATAGQWALDRALLLTPMMESGSTLLNGSLLIAAGLYQWTPLKHACLSKCRAPV
ncbi:MAG TPA: DUF2182 domain-containing protein, partial [Mycoplana sp.]|nr:DUF2182 domain-containing protein [Mycoplana sp.]